MVRARDLGATAMQTLNSMAKLIQLRTAPSPREVDLLVLKLGVGHLWTRDLKASYRTSGTFQSRSGVVSEGN
jgi:hypothetical protein